MTSIRRDDPHAADDWRRLTAVLVALALAVGTVNGLAIGGALSGLLTDHGWSWRSDGWLAGLAGLLRDPGHPGRAFGHPDIDARLWWTVTGVVELSIVATIATTVLVVWARYGNERGAMASARVLRRSLGARAAQKRASRSRPSLAGRETQVPMSEVAVSMGRAIPSKIELYGQHEDAEISMAGTRIGKSSRRIIPCVLDAPGAVVTTSTKGDVLAATVGVREQVGPIHVFDPEDVTGWPTQLRWNPIRGCEDPDEAIRHARTLVAARPMEGTTNGSFFVDSAARVLRAWLHAAALGGKTMRDVLAWSTQWADDEPIMLLQERSTTSAHWAAVLRDLTTNAAGEMIGGISQTLNLVLDPLNSPRLLEACSPAFGQEFDVEGFLRSRGTLYVISEGGVGSAGPFTTALVKHVHTQAKRLAATFPDGRLDPPLRCPWDEVANIAAAEDLGQMLSDSGGRGIHMIVASQGWGQLEKRWGRDEAREIWNSATTRIVFGGVAEADTLEDLSRLVGETKVMQATHSTGEFRRTRSTSYSWERALRIDQLRTLADGRALLLYRNVPATIVHLDAWWDLPAKAELLRLKAEAEQRMGRKAAS
jgi:hypothetical protein